MNVVRSRIPMTGIALAAVLTAGAAVAAVPLEAQRPPGRKPAAQVAPQPADPCCEITAIGARAGVVTAKDLETGETFRFRVTDRRLLASLSVGQNVYADQGAKKAGLSPGEPCCEILAGATDIAPAGPIDGVRPAQPINGVRPAQPINGVRPAQPIDGVRPAQPVNGVRPAQPINDVRPAQPIDGVSPAAPIDGIIVGTDIRTGAVTARATNGAHVRFRVADRARLRALRPGQQVSIDHVASQAQSAGARLDMLTLIWVEAGARAGIPAPPPGSAAACKEQEKQPQNAGKICLMKPNEVGTNTFTWSCVCEDENLVDQEDSDVKKEKKDGGTP